MMLDTVYGLVWRRRLARVLYVSLPLLPLLGLLAIISAVLARMSLLPIVGLFDDLPYMTRLQATYKLAAFVGMLPVALAFILLPKVGSGMNEAAGALPISRVAWARVTTKYYYASVLPVAAGCIAAFGVVGNSRLELGQRMTIFLMLYVALVAITALFAALYVSQFVLVAQTKRLGYYAYGTFLVLASGCVYLLAAHTGLTAQQDGQVVVPASTVWLWLGCFGMFAAYGSYARRRLRLYERYVLEYTQGQRNEARRRTVGWISSHTHNITVVMAISSIRDPQVWSIYGSSLLLSSLFVGVAVYLGRPQFSQLVLGALPILLVTGCMSVVASLRAGLGGSRNAIYAFPITNKKVTVSVLAMSWALVSATVVGFIWSAHKLLDGAFGTGDLERLLLLSSSAAGLACLASIVFFETKKDMAKGLMSSVSLFMAASPLLMLDGWLRSRGLWQYGALALVLVSMVVVLLRQLEQRLTRSEYA